MVARLAEPWSEELEVVAHSRQQPAEMAAEVELAHVREWLVGDSGEAAEMPGEGAIYAKSETQASVADDAEGHKTDEAAGNPEGDGDGGTGHEVESEEVVEGGSVRDATVMFCLVTLLILMF